MRAEDLVDAPLRREIERIKKQLADIQAKLDEAVANRQAKLDRLAPLINAARTYIAANGIGKVAIGTRECYPSKIDVVGVMIGDREQRRVINMAGYDEIVIHRTPFCTAFNAHRREGNERAHYVFEEAE